MSGAVIAHAGLMKHVMLLFVALGCGSSVTSNTVDASADASDASPAVDAADAAPVCVGSTVQTSSACQQCQDTHCCINASLCGQTPGTWTCSGQKVCLQNACATECGELPATCGAIVPDPPSCVDATRKACCAELTACGQSDECLALIYQCIDGQSCDPTMPCFKKCRAQWPNGAKLFDALDACGSKVACP
jgi:hypothetical protein